MKMNEPTLPFETSWAILDLVQLGLVQGGTRGAFDQAGQAILAFRVSFVEFSKFEVS